MKEGQGGLGTVTRATRSMRSAMRATVAPVHAESMLPQAPTLTGSVLKLLKNDQYDLMDNSCLGRSWERDRGCRTAPAQRESVQRNLRMRVTPATARLVDLNRTPGLLGADADKGSGDAIKKYGVESEERKVDGTCSRRWRSALPHAW
jgi:hypothetical protein